MPVGGEDGRAESARIWGKVRTFSRATGNGIIACEVTGRDYVFDTGQVRWDKPGSPEPGKRYSFQIESETDGSDRAILLEVA